jgi:hypothetical protein
MKKILFVSAFFIIAGIASAQQAPLEHNILSSQLPPVLLKDIKKDYKGYWISGLSEENKNKRASYFITIENADQIIKLRCGDAQNWVVMSTTMKA